MNFIDQQLSLSLTGLQRTVLQQAGLLLLVLLLLSPAGSEANAQDAQWRGPERNGIYPDKELLKQWPDEGPELLLRVDSIGNGYSTPVMYGSSIFITGRRDSTLIMSRLDLEGRLEWQSVFGRPWEGSYRESRATPTIVDGRVYITGGMGNVACLDAATGKVLWQRNTHEEYGGRFHRWGQVESLVVTGDLVISSPMGEKAAVVALNRFDGSVVWESADRDHSRCYASPILMQHGDRQILLACSIRELIGLDPATGEILFARDVETGYTGEWGRRNLANTPLVSGDKILISSGYNSHSLFFQLNPEASDLDLLWHNADMDVHHGGMVLIDGYVYGSNWDGNGKGNWVCQEWETGKLMWEETWYNKGSIISADGLLYIFDEKQGNVGLVKPDPESFQLISSFQLEKNPGPRWAHMSIYDQKLLIRHGETLYVYDIESSP